MGLMDDLAATRVHVLVVGVPGFPLLRMRALAAVRRRGWVAATSPADADVLLVCGAADEGLRAAIDAAWAQVPGPRARRTATDAAALDGLLDSAVRVLGDRRLQAESRSSRPQPESSAVDRLRLGPVLPDWPAGVVIDGETGGGAVVDATVAVGAVLSREDDPLHADETAFVQACDRAARLLRLAGWPAEALRLDRSVDRVLAGESAASHLPDVRRTAARVARSVLLRSSLAPVPGEVLQRLLVILGDAERGALGEPGVDEPVDPAALGEALRGVRVDQARLLVAAAGADPIVEAVPDEDSEAAEAPRIPWARPEPEDDDGSDDLEARAARTSISGMADTSPPPGEGRSAAEPRDHPQGTRDSLDMAADA